MKPGGWSIIDLMLGSGLDTSATQDKYSTIHFHREELARYLATVRGPNSPELVFTLLPRPTGEAARVVITEYDIPIANQARRTGVGQRQRLVERPGHGWGSREPDS